MIILGIDTGGTYTDAVLFETNTGQVIGKAKAPTTHASLEDGIMKSIGALSDDTNLSEIEKVVLSTTLATNAIVEGQGHPTGLILIGDPPKGELPSVLMAQVGGKVNVKGKIITPLDADAAEKAIQSIAPHVEAFAVSGMMSVRNAALELQVKAMIQESCALPVVCGHELSAKLGFHDRTVTCILNASLIPIIEDFIKSVEKALKIFNIHAPVFMVKGDGALASLSFIRKKPIESILSGPAASIMGAMALTKAKDGIVIDMGGTTTDSAVVRDHSLALSSLGASVGGWQTQVDSAKITTWGLGGDTQIVPRRSENEYHISLPYLTGRRVLPACRGGEEGLTPTDLLHLTGAFVQWDPSLSKTVLDQQAEACQMLPEEYIQASEDEIFNTIEEKVLSVYRNERIPETEPQYGYLKRVEGVQADTEDLLKRLPVIAIGAPAGVWYTKLRERTGQMVLIPEHYEVANAVGAACASVEERIEVLVRPDEAEDAFVVHAGGECEHFAEKETAVDWAKEKAEAMSRANALAQGAPTVTVQTTVEEIVERTGLRERYVETRIRSVARASGVVFERRQKSCEDRA